jgi:hypothetical protein
MTYFNKKRMRMRLITKKYLIKINNRRKMSLMMKVILMMIINIIKKVKSKIKNKKNKK